MTKRPVIANLFSGSLVKRPLFAVGVSVSPGDRVPYVLVVGAPPTFLPELLGKKYAASAGWVAVMRERSKTIMASEATID